MCIVAEKLAAILAENEATVEELNEIFQQTRRSMVVAVKPKKKTSLGRIVVPDLPDSDGWIGNK